MDRERPTTHADSEYEARRASIATKATGPHRRPGRIDYLESEHATWRTVKTALDRQWNRLAAEEILDARDRFDLPNDHLPQLDQVTRRLRPLSGFEFRAVPGLVPVEQFFGSLAEGVFLSTQYVRHHRSPLYTPEPDVIHEVIGHGTCLAVPRLGRLHRAAGWAMTRLETERARRFVADVFWFSAEFGVLRSTDGPKAYGAGLLSSVGELDHIVTGAEIRPLDIEAMGTLPYDIARFQPVLFGARSLDEVLDVVGRFFDEVSEDDVDRILSTAAV